MEPIPTPPDTAFAPAARAGRELFAWQRNAFLSDLTAVALLEAMPGPAMVLNRQRQIVAANSQLQVMFSPGECESLVGLRPGEALGCVRASERSTGCGTTPACAQCGAVQAILESLSTRGRAVKECRVRTSFRTNQGAFNFRVYATFAEIGGEEMVVFALLDTTDEKKRQALERTLFEDLREECAEVQPKSVHLAPGEADPADEEAFRREFSDLSSRVLEQIEAHRQLLAAESGELELEHAEVNVRGLLEKAASECRQSAVGRGRKIDLRAEGFATLRTDPVQLGRVLDGLLRNALEATPQDGRVEIAAVHEGDGVTITVLNAGMIPQDVQHQVFQRSFSTKNGQGRGIGTYSVKLLVERYLGGAVEFSSDETFGTTFTIVIPDGAPKRQAA
jgi:hypothetical protein